ncbi:hypothetical protein Pan241w_26180 [Gimesia alba]|uniref:Uncharacterized protein n=1 Tax=Gimesia alba TaxID=2527973 RepID=A0A517RF80_9PLAN|nr:hypothetical protein [Gimesia alba]QDT42533.1 hypothetical protein Pan241w_26180 [Gimesia alba]
MHVTESQHVKGYKNLMHKWSEYLSDFKDYANIRCEGCFFENDSEEEKKENKLRNQFTFFLYGYQCSIQLRTKLESVEFIVKNICLNREKIFQLNIHLYFDHNEKEYSLQHGLHENDSVSFLIINMIEETINQ